jgi:hypothetical protein
MLPKVNVNRVRNTILVIIALGAVCLMIPKAIDKAHQYSEQSKKEKEAENKEYQVAVDSFEHQHRHDRTDRRILD